MSFRVLAVCLGLVAALATPGRAGAAEPASDYPDREYSMVMYLWGSEILGSVGGAASPVGTCSTPGCAAGASTRQERSRGCARDGEHSEKMDGASPVWQEFFAL